MIGVLAEMESAVPLSTGAYNVYAHTVGRFRVAEHWELFSPGALEGPVVAARLVLPSKWNGTDANMMRMQISVGAKQCSS